MLGCKKNKKKEGAVGRGDERFTLPEATLSSVFYILPPYLQPKEEALD